MVLGFWLLQFVDLLDEGAELNFRSALDLTLNSRLDGRQVGVGHGGGDSGGGFCLLDVEGGEDAEVAQVFGPELIPRPTELPKLIIKVSDLLMQGVPLGPSLGHIGVVVPCERADDSNEVADKVDGLLRHAGGPGSQA